MSQRFDGAKPRTASGVLSEEIRLNFGSTATLNLGPNPPADPLQGMPWLDSSDPTNYRLNVYLDGSWHVILNNITGPPPAQTSVDRFVHTQGAAAVTWTVNHNLNSLDLVVQLWTPAGELILPQSVNLSNPNTAIIGFNAPVAGRAIVLG